MTGFAIEANGLTKSYDGRVAVNGVDLAVPAGAVLGFLGPNGAGKTTVIRILSTILTSESGSFTVAGVPDHQQVRVRRVVGVLPESAGYPGSQTGREWLTFHARLFGQPRQQAAATAGALLDEVDLADRGRSAISSYSRGMRQRLGIARALVNDPRVVILDEPTLGLDPAGQDQLLDLISRVARERGATVVLSTHQLDEVERVCDRVVILHHGRVVAEGTVAQVTADAAADDGRLRTAFLSVTEDPR
jgi:ABC-2 type transport system ATP-binding protein